MIPRLSASGSNASSAPRLLALSAPPLPAWHLLPTTPSVAVSCCLNTIFTIYLLQALSPRYCILPLEICLSDKLSPGVRLDLLSVSASPENKYTPPHARQGHGMHFSQASRRNVDESPTCAVTADDRDDVFTSPTKTLKERRSEHSITVANLQRLDVVLANSEEHPLRESSSNLNARHQINGVDAQNLYPPTACVFVAK